ncbi:MAG: hypothetical protein M3Y77_14680 [Actinomycetota bacterium]|nr:hypothetical protein [Actinomycetota bacterium]
MAQIVPLYVESCVNLASAGGAAGWTFDLRWWGRVGQGADEREAVRDLSAQLGDIRTQLVERIQGDEQAFVRDLAPVRWQQRCATLEILQAARADTVRLVGAATDDQLDRVDPTRRLPGWASWVTARDLAWHIADTESRYYLPCLGFPARPRLPYLLTELPPRVSR